MFNKKNKVMLQNIYKNVNISYYIIKIQKPAAKYQMVGINKYKWNKIVKMHLLMNIGEVVINCKIIMIWI